MDSHLILEDQCYSVIEQSGRVTEIFIYHIIKDLFKELNDYRIIGYD
jgi:hypothetical protein